MTKYGFFAVNGKQVSEAEYQDYIKSFPDEANSFIDPKTGKRKQVVTKLYANTQAKTSF